LDQYTVNADTVIHFTPMHKTLRLNFFLNFRFSFFFTRLSGCFVYSVKQKQKKFADFLKKFLGHTKNLGSIGSVVLMFIGYKETDKQADRQTSKVYIEGYIFHICIYLLVLNQSGRICEHTKPILQRKY